MSDEANDFLMGSAAPSISWKDRPIGTTVRGTVSRPPRKMQQRDIKDGKPLTWDDGSPRWQLVVNLRTELRDPTVDGDDGERSLYVKGKSMTDALRDAVRRAGAPGIEVGAELSVTYVGDGPKTNPKFDPPRLYSATYSRPVATGDSGAFLDGTQNSSAFGAPDGTQHAEAQASHLANARLVQPVAASAPPCPPGIDPAVWQGMDAATRTAVLASVTAGMVPPF